MKSLRIIKRLSRCTLLGCFAWAFSYAPTGLAAVANVSIGDDFFSPASTSINVGDQVTWTWTGSIPHSTTSNTSLWDSGIHTGGAFTFSHTFNSAGSFAYHCGVHAFMTASINVQSANVPPTVAITSPTNGAVLNAPASFALVATATDSDGSVTNVQFLRGAASLGNVTNSPYSVSVSNLAAGNYTFSAVASDNGGLRATNAISLRVNALPTVSILAPTNGASFAAPWSGTIQVTASDSDGTVSAVELFAGADSLGTVTNPPQNFSIMATNLGAGTYDLTARATDNEGGSATSTAVTINVVTPVAITLSSPVALSSASFQFVYSANAGLTYVVQRSGDMLNWSALSTNAAAANPVVFTDDAALPGAGYYRVELLPNP